MPRNIAVLDAETDPFRKGRIPKPFIWGFYDGSQYFYKKKTSDMVAFLSSYDGIVYAHNGGKFDYHYLFDYLEPWDTIKIINGRIASMHIGICELRDSYLIINEPLSKYKKDDIDYAIMESETRYDPANWQKIKYYLKSDCVYLWEMVIEFIRLYGNTLTQAGASMKQWQKLSNMPVPETDYDFYKEISDFYYGGRVECFEDGVINTDFAVYDINSAYAEAMLHKHPYSSNFEYYEGYLKNADFYKISCVSLGALPFRGSGSNTGNGIGLSFPTDGLVREYCITKWELACALRTKTIQKVRYIASYRFMTHTDFSVYINQFWAKRKAAQAAIPKDILGDLMAKLMMNSLYGKFAANPDNYYNYMIVPAKYTPVLAEGVPVKKKDKKIAQQLAKWEYSGELGSWALAQRELDDSQKRYYNVATGASITGYVRAKLWEAIHSCGGVLYCDTDSIACRTPGKIITLGNELGQWKHEGNFDKAGIGGKKVYIFRGARDWWKDKNGKTVQQDKKPSGGERLTKTATKGARLTNAELWRVAHGGVVEYERDVPTYSVTKPLDWAEPDNSFLKRTIRNTAKRKG